MADFKLGMTDFKLGMADFKLGLPYFVDNPCEIEKKI